MKKFITFIIVLSMLLSATTSFAASNLKEFVESLGVEYFDDGKLTQDVPVPTDISVKTQSGIFENGPLILSLYNAKNTKFSFKASIDMDNVIERYEDYKTLALALISTQDNAGTLTDELNGCTVSGQFRITINYPTENFTVNPNAKTDRGMVGFTSGNGRHLNIFEETVARDYSTDGQIVITVDVIAGTTIDDLADLSDLYLTYDNNIISADGEYTIRGSITGETTIKSGNEEIETITYKFNQEVGKENDEDYQVPPNDISATVIVDSPSTTLGGGTRKTLTIMDGETEVSKTQYLLNTVIETGKLEMPKKYGCVFAGYYYDKELTQPVEESFKLTDDKIIYIKWKDCVLNQDNHFAYIIGYPMENGREEVRPENNMTREEIATVFYRLLKDEVRDELFTAENSFPDVEVERWSNKAISTVAKGEYVNGYEDGTFKPANPITRAEFVTIATRFYAVDEVYTNDVDFTDVSGHWAEKYIKYATASGWIDGYEDNTFKPDKYITRAEVMKIINHMLGRAVNEEGLVEDAKRWIDNSQDKWYYYEVIEATNFHSYNRAQSTDFETWTAILENEILIDKPEYEDA